MKILNLYAGIGGNRKLLRNAVHPEMGKYILEQLKQGKDSND